MKKIKITETQLKSLIKSGEIKEQHHYNGDVKEIGNLDNNAHPEIPNEMTRNQAINFLVKNDIETLTQSDDTGWAEQILSYGWRGYTNYSNSELEENFDTNFDTSVKITGDENEKYDNNLETPEENPGELPSDFTVGQESNGVQNNPDLFSEGKKVLQQEFNRYKNFKL